MRKYRIREHPEGVYTAQIFNELAEHEDERWICLSINGFESMRAARDTIESHKRQEIKYKIDRIVYQETVE